MLFNLESQNKKMRYLTAFVLLIAFTFSLSAQRPTPVTWDINMVETPDSQTAITFKADIQEGWVIYGLEVVEDGPIATSINFDENEGVELVGELEAKSKLLKMKDDLSKPVKRQLKYQDM